jgi:branched-chain amino acid aminotransferase
MAKFNIEKTKESRISEVDWNNLRFGVYFSDHIFISDFVDGKWDGGRIEPYRALPMEPGLCTLHYGQTIFEGLKAFKSAKGGANIFRPDMNANRLNNSAKMVCLPEFDVDTLIEGIKELVMLDRQWIPQERGQSLYIRPVMFGSSNFLGVTASPTTRLIVMTSPVASYYAEGLKPIKILVSTEYVRAVKGGVGMAKTAANYAASLKAGMEAHSKGFSQVLWLDGVNRKDIDEVGAMNIMFVIDGELITPSLDKGSILAGITRGTVLNLAKEMGMKVTERNISIDEVIDAHNKGILNEVFGTGTAAVISPVGMLSYLDKEYVINNMEIGPVAQKFYDTITAIQYGEVEDTRKWNVKIDF